MRHSVLQPLLDPGNTGKPRNICLQQGKEAALSTVLDGLAKICKHRQNRPCSKRPRIGWPAKSSLSAAGWTFCVSR